VMALIATAAKGRSDPGQAAGFGLLAFAWNPLVLITVPLAGSADVALAAAIVGAILARRRGRTGLATVLLTLGALVKIYGVIGIVMRLLAGGALLAVVARAVAKVRDEQTLWRYTIVVLVAYLFLTPWFLYWYMLAPLTMVAVLPLSEFTYPILLFSGTSLFSIGTPFHLKNLLPQTLVR